MVLSLVTFNRSNRPEVSCKKGVLKISQNSRENTCEKKRDFIKKRLRSRCIPVNFAKFLRTPSL